MKEEEGSITRKGNTEQRLHRRVHLRSEDVHGGTGQTCRPDVGEGVRGEIKQGVWGPTVENNEIMHFREMD